MDGASPAAASTAEQVAELLAGGRVLAAQQLLRADPCDAATVQEVDAACDEVGTALRQLGRPGDDTAWRLALDNELLTFHKQPAEEEPHVHGVWFSGRLPAMTQHVVALAREFDLVQAFAGKFLFDTRVLGVESLLKLTVYSALWVPVLSDRDFAVYVRGYDCLDEHGCVVIAFNDDARFDAQLPQDRVRLRFKTSYLQLTPLPGNHTRATLVAHGTTNDELVISLCCRALTPILCLPVNPRMPRARWMCLRRSSTGRCASCAHSYSRGHPMWLSPCAPTRSASTGPALPPTRSCTAWWPHGRAPSGQATRWWRPPRRRRMRKQRTRAASSPALLQPGEGRARRRWRRDR